MGRNLTNLHISESFQYLMQVSGSENDINDGLGNDIDTLNVTASYATQALTASFAENVTTPTLQEVTDAGATTTNSISISNRVYGQTGISSGNSGETYTVRGGTVNATLTLQGNDVASTNSIKLNPTTGVQISGSLGIQDDITIAGDLTGLASSVNVNSITASFASFQSASIGYLEAITGSAKIIGDAFIILNNNTPTERYAGLVVQDSGSTNNTASLEFDGQTNDWFYEYTDDGGATVDHGVAMFGPEYNTKGSPVYPSNNTILKGNGGHHVEDSNITDDGTLVTINSNVSASGYVSASTFIGDGSGLTGVGAFPFTGSAEITGSLDVIGPITTGDGNSTATGLNSAVIGGSGNAVSNTDSVIIGGNGNTATGTYAGVILGNGQQANALRCVIVGGEGNRATAGQATTIAGGFNNASTITQGFMGGGSSNTASGNQTGTVAGTSNTVGGTRNTVIGGLANNVNGEDNGTLAGRSNQIANGEYNVITGGRDNVITGGSFYSVIASGNANQVTGGNRNGIFSGWDNRMSGNQSAVVGGGANNVSGDFSFAAGGENHNVSAGYSAIVGGNAGSIADTYGFIGGGTNHTISAGAGRGGIVGGQQNTISSGEASGILGGYLNDVSATTAAVVGGRNASADHQDSVVLGGDGLSTSKTQEAVVEHLTANGQVKGAINVLTDAAGTTALDCSVGNYFTLAMPAGGTTALTPSNITAGQTINIKITQNATAATLTYDSAIEFPGGTPFTISTGGSEVDVLTLVSFDGTTLQATGLANFS